MSLAEIKAKQIDDPKDPFVYMFSFLISGISSRFGAVNISEVSVPVALDETVTIGNYGYSYGYIFAAMLAQHVREIHQHG